jgi:hypothetical protein
MGEFLEGFGDAVKEQIVREKPVVQEAAGTHVEVALGEPINEFASVITLGRAFDQRVQPPLTGHAA